MAVLRSGVDAQAEGVPTGQDVEKERDSSIPMPDGLRLHTIANATLICAALL
jgi:hypothetical protein